MSGVISRDKEEGYFLHPVAENTRYQVFNGSGIVGKITRVSPFGYAI
jgi:hypothetical protein